MVEIGNVINDGFSKWQKQIGFLLLFAVIYAVIMAGLGISQNFFINQNVGSLDLAFEGIDSYKGFVNIMLQIFSPEVIALTLVAIVFAWLVPLLLLVLFIHKIDPAAAKTNSVGVKFGYLVLYSILSTIIISVGFALLIIPGIIALYYLLLGSYAIVTKGKGPIEALTHSFELVKDNWWRTLGYSIVIGFIVFAASFVVGMLFGIITVPLALFAPGIVAEGVSSFFGATINMVATAIGFSMFHEYYLGLEAEKGLK